jgi:inorganic triphosphatase YgiF
MAREIELKFETDADSRHLIIDSGVLDGAKARRTAQETVYFDTPTGSVRRRGYSLRIRRSPKGFVQTVKHRTNSPAGLFSREEYESAVEGFEVDLEAVDRTPLGRWLTPGLRRKLRPVVCTRFERTSWRLTRGGSRIEATLDEGEVIAGESSMPLIEFELELAKGDIGTLFELADQVGRTIPLRLGVLSKAERGFALADGRLEAASKAEPIWLRPEMNVGDAFAAAAHSCLRHFRLNKPLVLARRDAAALHQARVAIRRLRSALTLFRPAIADWEFDRMRDSLRRLAGELGEARNLDVLIERLPAKMSGKVAREKLGRKREAAYERVEALLESARTRALMLNLIRWFETGGWRARARAAKPLGPFARDQLAKRWRRVTRRGDELGRLDPAGLHALRIDVKKMRYSAEFLSGLHDSKHEAARSAEFGEALRTLQDRLGEINDGEVARDLLDDLKLGREQRKAAARSAGAAGEGKGTTLGAAAQAYAQARAAAGYWD